MAQEVICKNRQRQVALAFLLFADEHDQYLPGNRSDRDNVGDNAWMADWLFGSNPTNFDETPQKGTLWPYIGDAEVYLCPSLPFIQLNSREGSNGRFDFTAWESFTGAKVANLPTETVFGGYETLSTPLVTEEEPAYYMNNSYKDGGHGNWDKTGHWHRGGANHAAVDGSAMWFQEDWSRNANDWMTVAPSGAMTRIGKADEKFGWWNEQ